MCLVLEAALCELLVVDVAVTVLVPLREYLVRGWVRVGVRVRLRVRVRVRCHLLQLLAPLGLYAAQ